MSRRFGRNQKRRMREEIASLAAAHQIASGLSRHLGERVRQTEDALTRITRAIARYVPNSSLLPADERICEVHAYDGHLRVMLYPPMDLRPSATSMSETMSGRIVDLYRLEAFVDQNWEKFGYTLHLKTFDPAAKSYFYFVSHRVLSELPPEERHDMALRLARQLVETFERANGGCRRGRVA